MSIGTVEGFKVGKNRDGTKDVVLLTVEIYKDDIQTVELMTHAGDDTIPPNGSKVIVLSVGDAWKIGIATNDGVKSTMKSGEKKLYSSSNGIIKAFINWLSGGNLELNGNGDFLVRFNKMQASFDEFRSQVNANWAKYSLHKHTDSVSGTTTVPDILSSPITANMSQAKVDTVKVP